MERDLGDMTQLFYYARGELWVTVHKNPITGTLFWYSTPRLPESEHHPDELEPPEHFFLRSKGYRRMKPVQRCLFADSDLEFITEY